MSAARAAMSASAATSARTGLCARGARRVPRRGAPAVPRAVPSEERSDVDAPAKRKPPPSVIVGGLFVAEAPQTDDEARAGSDRRASTSAKRLPYGVATARGDVSESLDDETQRTKARIQTLETTALAHEAISMWLGAAVLGPLLDHQHSRFDVLHYFQPVTLDLASGLVRSVAEKTAGAAPAALAFFFQRETGVLETAWWVPPLFGGAGVVIGLGHTLGDGLRLRAGALKETFEGVDKQTFLAACPGRPVTGWEPAPKTVALAVAFFAAQYFFSGALATTVENPFGIPNETPRVAVDVVLAVSGLAAWWGFDRTAQGFAMASLTALAGPAAEIFLINVAHLYAYAAPDVLGVPTWIPWVYFCGAPAVGLLARAVRAERRAALRLPKPTADVAPPPRRKAWRPPPRGFQAEGLRSEAGDLSTRAGLRARAGARGRLARPRGKVTVVPEGGGVASASVESSGSSEKKASTSAAPRGSGSAAGDTNVVSSAVADERPRGSRTAFATETETTAATATRSSRRERLRARGNLNPKPLTLNGATEAEETDCPYVDEVEGVAGDDASEAGDADVARGSENARRSARRAALRREVTALQRLKLRLEKVRDALVREK